MSQDLRLRVTSMPSNSEPMARRNQVRNESYRLDGGLTLSAMLKAAPQEHGLVMNLHIPLLFSILPAFLQSFISKVSFLKRLFGPRWEKRYIVLLGNFLYKFSDQQAASSNHQTPKGSPIPVDSVQVHLPELGQGDLGCVSLPRGFSTVVEVSNWRKKWFFATHTPEQAMTWVNCIRQAQQDAVMQSMGHTHVDSYPRAWAYFDTLGQGLLNSKERVRARLQEKNMREMEMSSLNDGGPLLRGYYG